jgi:hypothetical protein
MKKPFPKSKPATTPEAKPTAWGNLMLSLSDATGLSTAGLPTTEQLAAIAATLARDSSEPAEALVKAAMNLWTAAQREITRAALPKEGNLTKGIKEAEKRFWRGVELPVSRDQFLRVMLPQIKHRTAELGEAGRIFLERLLARDGKEHSKDEVDNLFDRLWPFEDAETAEHAAQIFEKLRQDHISEARRAAGRESASKRKKKKIL